MDTKYQIITSQIKNKIQLGILKPGIKLPSIRNLCKDFSCSSTTALKIYNELEIEHLIYSKPKSGYFVIGAKDNTYTSPDKKILNFSFLWPAIQALPYKDIQHCLNQAIDIYQENLFATSNSQGLPSLCKAMAKHLQGYQIFTSPNNIFITSGSQQALALLSHMPFPNGKQMILVEQPTYMGMLKILEINNIAALGIERSSKGIDLDMLEKFFCKGNIKFFYTIPRFHNPTGYSYNNEQKKQILKLAVKYDVYIVEDDYLADLETDCKSDPIYSFDTSSHVIYVRSFSKTLLPGLRTGIVALPDLLTEKFFAFKRYSDLSSSVLSQGALEIYLKSGMHETHTKCIKAFYNERMKTLNTACTNSLNKKIEFSTPYSGFFTCMELPKGYKASSISGTLKIHNVQVFNTCTSFLPEFYKDNLLSLTICRIDNEGINKGISIIAKELDCLLKTRLE